MWPSRVFWRYMLFQLPGWVVATIVLALLVRFSTLEPHLARWLLLFWFVKDIVLYPHLKIGYESHPSPAGPDALLGALGTTMTPLAPGAPGRVRIGPEQWKAELADDAGALASGAPIRVVAINGLTLRVEAGEA